MKVECRKSSAEADSVSAKNEKSPCQSWAFFCPKFRMAGGIHHAHYFSGLRWRTP